MAGRIWMTLRIFAALFQKIPMIEARVLLPSMVLLLAFPVLMALWPDQPDMAFVVAFVLCQTARFSLRWREQFSNVGLTTYKGRWRMVAAFFIPAAVVFAAQNPGLCQHVPSIISAGFVGLFAIDALDGSYSTARAYWPGAIYAPYASTLTQAMLVLHLTYILLNETIVRAVPLQGWIVFYAAMPVLHHVLLTAVFRTVFWVSATPERRL